MTKKGLEADIAKLSRLINGGVTTSKQLIDKAGAYFEGETTLGELIDKSKPLLRKQKLEIEIFALKAQLEIVNRMIDVKKRRERDKENQADQTKKATNHD